MDDFEDHPVHVLVSIVESKLALFEVQVKGGLAYPSKSCEARFRKAPEAFDSVDMGFPPGEFVTAMIHTEVLAIANIDKAIVTTPAVGIDDAFGFDLATNNGLQRGFGAVRHNFGVDFAITFKHTENDCFTVSTATAFPLDAPRAKERFINLDLPG